MERGELAEEEEEKGEDVMEVDFEMNVAKEQVRSISDKEDFDREIQQLDVCEPHGLQRRREICVSSGERQESRGGGANRAG